MFTLHNVVQPDTLQNAYKVLIEKKSNTVIGGCSWLRMGSHVIHTGVDLSNLGLNYIHDCTDYIEIGAMATLRDIETNMALGQHFAGVLPKAVSNIIGVQFRNVATVGASVFSRFGFSDLLTALMVVDTDIELYKGGRKTLAEFLEMPRSKDILTKVIVHKTKRRASYHALRNSASDFPILTVAASQLDDEWKIAVGARPIWAKMAVQAAKLLSAGVIAPEDIAMASQMAAEELTFGDNARGSAEYRRAMCKVLVKRAIAEVATCK